MNQHGEQVRIYGVKVDGDGTTIDQWERTGPPMVMRGFHVGHNGHANEDGTATAESEQGHVHAVDIARMILQQAKEADR